MLQAAGVDTVPVDVITGASAALISRLYALGHRNTATKWSGSVSGWMSTRGGSKSIRYASISS